MDFRLEICVDSVESAINAQVAGADRIELCDNLPEGGTTPSFGTISLVRDNLDIAVHVIIRPRGGDFLYSDEEFEIMRRDIDICGESGIDGIVIGILRQDGSVDIDRTARLAEMAQPMAVTFHRAFDMCSNPLRGLEDIISAGASRLLTSGQKNIVTDGLDLIRKLIKHAGSRIIIMPGGGLNETNIADVARVTGASEFHLTARKTIESDMKFMKDGINMGGFPQIPEFKRKVADPEKIKNIINILKIV